MPVHPARSMSSAALALVTAIATLTGATLLVPAPAAAAAVRIATFNASLNRNTEGQLITDLATPNNAQAQQIAEIIQRVNPDIVLINEFDHDAGNVSLNAFHDNYLAVGQGGVAPVSFAYRFTAPSNTGVASGFDLDNNGTVGGPGDAQGFGFFEGQYGMAVYSKHPIDTANIRSFQQFLWRDMPAARLPADPDDADGNGDTDNWFTSDELDVVRLSSKSHWDIPVLIDGEALHVLAAHPTPPVFDGPEDRNGLRNHDEIRLWADYVTPGQGDYLYDDQGGSGGLAAGARFVIVGDYNADPNDGDSTDDAILQLLDNLVIDADFVPTSPGGTEQAAAQGGANAGHVGDPAHDTGDFGDTPPSSGNLRVDYVLPSRRGLGVLDGGVYWPLASDPTYPLVLATDHRLTWLDLEIEPVPAPATALLLLTGLAALRRRGRGWFHAGPRA